MLHTEIIASTSGPNSGMQTFVLFDLIRLQAYNLSKSAHSYLLPFSHPEFSASPARSVPHPRPGSSSLYNKWNANIKPIAARVDRFRHIMEMRAQGLFSSEIAKRVSMGERSVRQSVKQGGSPLQRRQPPQYL
jgi:hypothetical protein